MLKKKMTPLILGLLLVGIKVLYANQPANNLATEDKKKDVLTSVPDAAASSRMAATITNCRDGDTCRMTTVSGHMWMNVRLAGIDAPEIESKRKKSKGQPLGQAAKDFANAELAGQQVEIEQVDLDNYNRPVVVIWNKNKNFNLTIVEEGLAEAYRGPVKRIDRSQYIAAETKARTEKKGIWKIAPKDYVSPNEFRKSLRGQ